MPWKLIQAYPTQNSSFQPPAQVQSFSRCSHEWYDLIISQEQVFHIFESMSKTSPYNVRRALAALIVLRS
jgi:hypothetical protein